MTHKGCSFLHGPAKSIGFADEKPLKMQGDLPGCQTGGMQEKLMRPGEQMRGPSGRNRPAETARDQCMPGLQAKLSAPKPMSDPGNKISAYRNGNQLLI
jgi:hypothetical protein